MTQKKNEKKGRLSAVRSNELLDADKIQKDERRRVWKEVNKYIKPGILPGDGRDEQAERNGIIFAANIIFDLGI